MRLLDNPYWETGYNAYFNGIARDKNPHDATFDENLFELWQEGWDCADSDTDDN